MNGGERAAGRAAATASASGRYGGTTNRSRSGPSCAARCRVRLTPCSIGDSTARDSSSSAAARRRSAARPRGGALRAARRAHQLLPAARICWLSVGCATNIRSAAWVNDARIGHGLRNTAKCRSSTPSGAPGPAAAGREGCTAATRLSVTFVTCPRRGWPDDATVHPGEPGGHRAARHKLPGRASCRPHSQTAGACAPPARSPTREGVPRPSLTRTCLGVLAAPDLECDDDLGDAAEQGEEPDPEQQQRARAGNSCWEAQKPSTSSRMPTTRPSHQELLTSLVMTAVMMSSVPLKTSSSPSTEARAQKALKGRANAQIARHEQDAHQDVRPPPAVADRGDHELVDRAQQEQDTYAGRPRWRPRWW